jgi:ParB-like nuclease domain.
MPKPKFNFNPSDKSVINNLNAENDLKIGNIKENREKEKQIIPFNFKVIPIEKLELHTDNDFPQEGIERLGNSILENGLLHNLEVAYDEERDKYILESGERRYRAIKWLIDKFEVYEDKDNEQYNLYKENVQGFRLGLPANVKRDYEAGNELTEINSELRLIAANVEARDDKSSRLRNIQKQIKLLERKNELLKPNEKINVAKIIAEENKISERQVIKYKNVINLIPELQNALKEGNITLNEGSNYARLSEEEQYELFKLIEEGKKLSEKEVNEWKKQVAETKKLVAEREQKIETINEEKTHLEVEMLKLSKKLNAELEGKKEQIDLIREQLKEELESNSPNKLKIEELNKEIKGAKEDYEKVNEKINNYEEQICNQEKEIEKLKKEVDEKQPDINLIKKEIQLDSIILEIKNSIKNYKKILVEYSDLKPTDVDLSKHKEELIRLMNLGMKF